MDATALATARIGARQTTMGRLIARPGSREKAVAVEVRTLQRHPQSGFWERLHGRSSRGGVYSGACYYQRQRAPNTGTSEGDTAGNHEGIMIAAPLSFSSV